MLSSANTLSVGPDSTIRPAYSLTGTTICLYIRHASIACNKLPKPTHLVDSSVHPITFFFQETAKSQIIINMYTKIVILMNSIKSLSIEVKSRTIYQSPSWTYNHVSQVWSIHSLSDLSFISHA